MVGTSILSFAGPVSHTERPFPETVPTDTPYGGRLQCKVWSNVCPETIELMGRVVITKIYSKYFVAHTVLCKKIKAQVHILRSNQYHYRYLWSIYLISQELQTIPISTIPLTERYPMVVYSSSRASDYFCGLE